MKTKLLSGVLTIILILMLFTSCSGSPKSLNSCVKEVISLMSEMVRSEEYRSLYNLTPAFDDQINKLREGDYSKVSKTYEISVPMEELVGVEINREDFSEELYQYICSSAYSSFATRINQEGNSSVALAVSSVFTAYKTYTDKNMNESKIYLYVFENGYPIVISLAENGEDTFKVVGHFIINDEFVTDDEISIKESCEKLRINGVSVKKL